jgi:hypothetical protein
MGCSNTSGNRFSGCQVGGRFDREVFAAESPSRCWLDGWDVVNRHPMRRGPIDVLPRRRLHTAEAARLAL